MILPLCLLVRRTKKSKNIFFDSDQLNKLQKINSARVTSLTKFNCSRRDLKSSKIMKKCKSRMKITDYEINLNYELIKSF